MLKNKTGIEIIYHYLRTQVGGFG